VGGGEGGARGLFGARATSYYTVSTVDESTKMSVLETRRLLS